MAAGEDPHSEILKDHQNYVEVVIQGYNPPFYHDNLLHLLQNGCLARVVK